MKSLIIPPSKRTIFINDKKFFLNVPELTFFQDETCLFVWIVKDNILHYVPLLNINEYGYICNNYTGPMKDAVDHFFNSTFYFIIDDTLDLYAAHHAFSIYALTKYNNLTYNRVLNDICTTNILQTFFNNPIRTTNNIQTFFLPESVENQW